MEKRKNSEVVKTTENSPKIIGGCIFFLATISMILIIWSKFGAEITGYSFILFLFGFLGAFILGG